MQILSGLETLLSQCPSLELREAAAQFLGKCGSKEIPELYEVRMGMFTLGLYFYQIFTV